MSLRDQRLLFIRKEMMQRAPATWTVLSLSKKMNRQSCHLDLKEWEWEIQITSFLRSLSFLQILKVELIDPCKSRIKILVKNLKRIYAMPGSTLLEIYLRIDLRWLLIQDATFHVATALRRSSIHHGGAEMILFVMWRWHHLEMLKDDTLLLNCILMVKYKF